MGGRCSLGGCDNRNKGCRGFQKPVGGGLLPGAGLIADKARRAFQNQVCEVLYVNEWNFNFVI